MYSKPVAELCRRRYVCFLYLLELVGLITQVTVIELMTRTTKCHPIIRTCTNLIEGIGKTNDVISRLSVDGGARCNERGAVVGGWAHVPVARISTSLKLRRAKLAEISHNAAAASAAALHRNYDIFLAYSGFYFIGMQIAKYADTGGANESAVPGFVRNVSAARGSTASCRLPQATPRRYPGRRQALCLAISSDIKLKFYH